MEVKILGPGCARCKRVEQVAREAAAEAGIQANFVHVTDMASILAYQITSTPGLVVNEKLVSSGRIPQKEEIEAWLKDAKRA